MVIQVVGAAAGAVARGVAVGARVAGRASMTGVRVAAKGATSAARGAVKGGGAGAKKAAQGIGAARRVTTQAVRAGYRFGRSVAEGAREETSREKEEEKGSIQWVGDPKKFGVGDPRRRMARAYNAAPIPRFAKRAALEIMPAGTKRMASGVGLTQRAPRWARRQQLKNKARSAVGMEKNPVTPPISKNEGRFMIAVAVLFDLLPLLLIVGPIVAIFSSGGENPDCSWREGLYDAAVCKISGITSGLGGAAAIVAILFFSPAIYAVGSFFSVLLGLLVFGLWFMFRGVSPIRLGLYMIFETIPVVNLLPMFTVGVWRCVRGATR